MAGLDISYKNVGIYYIVYNYVALLPFCGFLAILLRLIGSQGAAKDSVGPAVGYVGAKLWPG